MPISTVEAPNGTVIGFVDLDATGSDATTSVKPLTRYVLPKAKRFHTSKIPKVDRDELEAAIGAAGGTLPSNIGTKTASRTIAQVAAEAPDAVALGQSVDLSAKA